MAASCFVSTFSCLRCNLMFGALIITDNELLSVHVLLPQHLFTPAVISVTISRAFPNSYCSVTLWRNAPRCGSTLHTRRVALPPALITFTGSFLKGRKGAAAYHRLTSNTALFTAFSKELVTSNKHFRLLSWQVGTLKLELGLNHRS